jgi:hypothetical protein
VELPTPISHRQHRQRRRPHRRARQPGPFQSRQGSRRHSSLQLGRCSPTTSSPPTSLLQPCLSASPSPLQQPCRRGPANIGSHRRNKIRLGSPNPRCGQRCSACRFHPTRSSTDIAAPSLRIAHATNTQLGKCLRSLLLLLPVATHPLRSQPHDISNHRRRTLLSLPPFPR